MVIATVDADEGFPDRQLRDDALVRALYKGLTDPMTKEDHADGQREPGHVGGCRRPHVPTRKTSH